MRGMLHWRHGYDDMPESVGPLANSLRASPMCCRLSYLTLLQFCIRSIVVLIVFSSHDGDAGETAGVTKEHADQAKLGLELFRNEIGPLLTAHCLECHGGEATKADFSVATREELMASGFVGRSASDSHLMALVRHADEPHMPFKQPRLSDEMIDALAKWIDLGAPYDRSLNGDKNTASEKSTTLVTDKDRQFWSFRRLQSVAAPNVRNTVWPRTVVDQFIVSSLEAKQLAPNPVASKEQLIRRAHLDLLGLPPTLEEIDQFVNDNRSDAYEHLIDRLLSSPHYGERWARHWLDVARFAESSGFEHDTDRPHAYTYRDFLVAAFNRDMPWDQMVQWQVAGDELAPDEPLAWMATGFLGAGVFPTQLTETEFESSRYDELDDVVGTLGVAFLGLSTGCARCHDHKFDPIPTSDYYRLVSVFATTVRGHKELPRLANSAGGDVLTQAMVFSDQIKPDPHHADGRGYPHFYPEVHYLRRGDVRQKEGVARAEPLQVLAVPDSFGCGWHVYGTSGNARDTDEPLHESRGHAQRTSLARWLTDSDQGAGHLVARVIVNRLWQHHFGRGLVATPNDFGYQGARPSHPELLDWLASDLIKHGWQLKRLHRLMMTSAVYMQSSAIDDDRNRIDIENQYLWHYRPRRLEAEAIRDSLLVAAGQLDTTLYGPGTLDETSRRRSIYYTIKRSQLIPLMQVFDWPEHLVSIGERSVTTIAPQSLALLNGPMVRGYARALADRVRPSSDVRLETAIESAYRITWGYRVSSEVVEHSAQFVRRQQRHYGASFEDEQQALADLCHALLASNEFLYLP